jgi:hypothetical protein
MVLGGLLVSGAADEKKRRYLVGFACDVQLRHGVLVDFRGGMFVVRIGLGANLSDLLLRDGLLSSACRLGAAHVINARLRGRCCFLRV